MFDINVSGDHQALFFWKEVVCAGPNFLPCVQTPASMKTHLRRMLNPPTCLPLQTFIVPNLRVIVVLRCCFIHPSGKFEEGFLCKKPRSVVDATCWFTQVESQTNFLSPRSPSVACFHPPLQAHASIAELRTMSYMSHSPFCTP